jgi:hypothetical protein
MADRLLRYTFCAVCMVAVLFMGLERVSRKERAKAMMGEISEGPYEPTPRWHPMYLFGWTLRRWIMCEPWDGSWWEYARPKTAARNVLEEQFGEHK